MNAENSFHGGPYPVANGQVKAKARTPQARLISFLDRAIVLLMAAIVLTLALPIGMVLWHQSRAAGESNVLCLRTPVSQPAPSFPTANRVRTA